MSTRTEKDYVLLGALGVSIICFFLSPLIATPIGTLADSILLERFQAAWAMSHDPTLPWRSLAAGENVFAFTTGLIALVALTLGVFAAREIYKRRNK